MAKYRKRPVVVDAVQWFPGVAIDGVEQMDPKVVFNVDRTYYCVEALGGTRMSDAWLEVEVGKGVNGPVLPFALWKVKEGETKPAVAGDPLVDRYVAHMGYTELPKPYGLINTLEGRMSAMPGDWIITGVKNEKYPCKPDVFEKTYEKVEE